jgi:type III secretory pathway component EscV
MEYVIRHLEAVLRFNLSDFVGHQEVASLLVELSQEKLDSFQSTSEKLSALTAVCKGLLVERVSITPFSEVCGVFEELYSPSASGQRIVESVRAQKRNLLPDSSDCVLLPTGPRVEAAMRSCVYRAGERSLVAMEPALCQSVLSAVRKQVPAGQATICVEDPEIRPLFRLVTEMEFPAVSVLSRRELQPGLETDASRRIELEEFEAAEQPGFATLPPVLIETKHPSAVESELSPEPEIVVFVNQTLISNRALADDHSLYETFPLIQEGLFSELGILLPTVRLEADGSLAPNQFRFTLNGVSSAIYPGLAPIDYLVNDTADRLRLLGIEGRAGLNPATGKASAIVSEETTPSETCRQAGLTTWGPVGFLTLVLSRDIRRAAASFQTFSVTKYILESLGALHPHLVDAAMKQFSIEQIMGTLRDLLDEEISIRDLRTILESLLSVGTAVDVDLTRYIVFVPPADRLLPARGGMSRVLTVADYSNWARCALKRYLSHKYSKGNSTLAVYLIAPEIEQRLADLHVRPLTEHEVARLIKAVKEEVGSIPPASSQNPVLLTSIEVRKQLRDLLKKDYPDLAVLSYQELSPELNIQPIARISWE